ncbi:M1 family metallopeptidase [Thiosocius teredinicola]|uniref:M1 family metallopeptidase n=1 Tax=Thiosocius teredinicola TaxID=1973002 RepID=UPI00099103B1
MSVELIPAAGEMRVTDEISVDRASDRFEFVLNSGLSLTTASGRLETVSTSSDGLRTAYRVTLKTPGKRLKLHYHGRPVFSEQRGHGDMPQGVVSQQAVYLDGASAWYPVFDAAITQTLIEISLPDGWQSLSMGRRDAGEAAVTWTSNAPLDDIYLLAGRFVRHARQHGDVTLSVWLLNDDPELADRYLGIMGDYIDHYSRLIGAYPFEKFAVVENHWQTGYGMPSFTLLGSQVMRLPFIPYTSLPHEILHNWWGNGVWIDYDNGNWSEGLTAYLADHWMQERQGKSDQYRLKALQRYSNYAAENHDQPLTRFVSRHNEASQSIGYSKSLMVFHMLRRALGDDAFAAGLKRLWSQHKFTRIGFVDAVNTVIGDDKAMQQQFAPWLMRPGAPHIGLGTVDVEQRGSGFHVLAQIHQRGNTAFSFDLPIAITLHGESEARWFTHHMSGDATPFEITLPAAPLRIDIDPQYDLLRYLDATEQPPALNRLFGGNSWLILPNDASDAMLEAWHDLARHWQQTFPGLRVTTDSTSIDAEDNRLLLGWDNRLLASATALFERDTQTLTRNGLQIGNTTYRADDHSVVLVSTDAHGVTTGFIGASNPTAVAALARKLTHYGSFGRLVFDAQTSQNQVRDALTSSHSTLSRQLTDAAVPLLTAPRAVLGDNPTSP